jgi:hypothetical protein
LVLTFILLATVHPNFGYDDALANVVVLSRWGSGEVVLVDGRSGRQTLSLPRDLIRGHRPAVRQPDRPLSPAL